MEEENKTAAEALKKPKLSDYCGIVPGKCLFATPPVFKTELPDAREAWPVFKFKPSDGLDFNQDLDRDEIYETVEGRRKVVLGKVRTLKLKRNLKDWKGFPYGSPIPCPKDAEGNITDEAIQALNPELQNWLLAHINGIETVSTEESEGLKF